MRTFLEARAQTTVEGKLMASDEEVKLPAHGDLSRRAMLGGAAVGAAAAGFVSADATSADVPED